MRMIWLKASDNMTYGAWSEVLEAGRPTDLKQKQNDVIDSKTSLEQGRIVLVFTLTTIIFVSFCLCSKRTNLTSAAPSFVHDQLFYFEYWRVSEE